VSSYVSKIAGKIKFHLKEWKSITSDQTILDIVKGCKFDFVENSDQIDQRETFTNIKEAAIIDNEIDKLAQEENLFRQYFYDQSPMEHTE
jgi:hypothetical protein